jgi:hypothetical protein
MSLHFPRRFHVKCVSIDVDWFSKQIDVRSVKSRACGGKRRKVRSLSFGVFLHSCPEYVSLGIFDLDFDISAT